MARRVNYRYTPRRQAQLRRAQYISAQKRRRRRQQVGAVAAGFGALFITKQLNRYAGDPRQIGRDYRDLKKLGGKAKVKGKKVSTRLRSRGKVRYSNTYQHGPWV